MDDLTSEIDAAESLMAELANDYVERLERGERPDIEQYVARWPGDARVVREALASLKLVRLSSAVNASDAALETADAAGRLGDFQLLREIGRGGMGVVYEARQESLGRRVALKILPFAGMVDPRQLQRFKNEAQAAAQLDHPNIVDVLAVGCERGVHFYAMRLIDGPTLAEVIAEVRRQASGDRRQEEGKAGCEPVAHRSHHAPHDGSPISHHAEHDAYGSADDGNAERATADLSRWEREHTEPNPKSKIQNPKSTRPIAGVSTDSPREYYRAVARLMADVAEALDYAHQAGVVHRDIKPSNLMLDSRGKVWIADFGLARIESNTEMTMTGDLLGTLRYMSPEQASGNRQLLDHRTDIYSLGATLYELLTLRPAFDGTDRRDLLRQITETEPARPRSVRASIASDLETIVGKALEKEPSHRYASAAALAADLRHFLAGEPIRARPLSVRQRVVRWTQRHVGLVYSVAAMLAVALSVSVAAGVAVYRSNRDKDDALAVAIEERQQADDALRVARRAVDRMYTDVAAEWLAAHGALTDVQEKFLNEALQFYEGFPKDHGPDYETRFQAAIAYLRIGELRCQLMKLDEAEQALAKAMSLFEQLVAECPHDPELRKTLALAVKARAFNSVRRGATDEAVTGLHRTTQILKELVAGSPENEPLRFELTDPAILDNYYWCGEYDEHVSFLHEARKHADGLMLSRPRRLTYLQRQVELDWRLCANVLIRNRDYKSAETVLARALALDASWAREEVEYPLFRWQLSFCADLLGHVYWATDRLAEAEDAYRLALEIRAEVARRFPNDHIKVHTELLAHRNLATLLDYLGKSSEANGQWREELISAERIARLESPESSALSSVHLIEGHRNLAESSLRVGDKQGAEDHALKSLHYLRRMPDPRPGKGVWMVNRAGYVMTTYAVAGRILASLGKYDAIVEHLAELASQLETEGTRSAVLSLSESLARAVENDEGLDPMQRSSLLASALTAASQCLASCDAEKMSPGECNGVGWFLATTDVAALRDVPRSLPFAESAVRRQPDNRNFLNTLGAARHYAGQYAEARTNLLRCLELDESQGLDRSNDLFFLAMTCWHLGEKEQARRWFDEGVSWLTHELRADGVVPLRREAEELLGIADAPSIEDRISSQ